LWAVPVLTVVIPNLPVLLPLSLHVLLSTQFCLNCQYQIT